MTSTSTIKIPKWFWVVSGIALVWNLLGILGFMTTVNLSPEALAAMPEVEQEIYRTTPIWATIGFAVGVFAGAIGSLGLLLRKSWAKPLLIASLIGVLFQMFHAIILAKGFEVYGFNRMIMPMAIIAICIFLVWFASMSEKREFI